MQVAAKQALDIRRPSSAIISAKPLKWGDSLAFSLPLDPVQVYELNARAWIDSSFREAQYGLGGLFTHSFDLAVLADRRLTEEELATLHQDTQTALSRGAGLVWKVAPEIGA